MVTDARGVHGDDLRVAGQFGGKEYSRDEDEQRAEHVHVVRQEGQVVLEDDLLERNLVLKEIVHFLREVEDDRNRQNQHDREKERTQEFLYYVPIESFQSLCIKLGITLAFQVEKSPARMCWRAWPTRSR